MIKKKLNILLLLLLAVLFIGSFSTTYARELTSADIKNFIYNYCIYYGYTEDEAEAYVTNFANLPNANDSSSLEIDRWLNIANNSYPGQWIIAASYNAIYLWRYNGSTTNMSNYGPYLYNNNIYINTSYLTAWKTTWTISLEDTLTTTGSQGNANLTLTANKFFYTDTNIYTNSTIANGSIKYNSGYMTPSNLFDGPYTDDYFSFLLNSSLQTMTINGDEVPYYDLQTNQAESFTLGQLGLAENFNYAELDSYRYKNGEWKHIGYSTLYNIGTTTDNLISVTIYGNMVNSNTLYNLTMYSNTDDLPNYSQPFYIVDRNTVITNGALNTEDTFSGDYYNNYNNDSNTESIINNINDDSEVDNTLNNFISGDAEDIANKFGFRLFNIEYYNFIHDTIVRLTNVLTEEEDVYFDYSMHGEAPTRIYASSFTTPNGALKTFLSLFLISCTVFAFYKYIADLLELISTGNILEALDEFKVDRNIFKM